MEPIKFQPAGETSSHLITAEVAEAENSWITFLIKSDGEGIGDVDIQLISDGSGFICGVGPGERINNGYLSPASLAIAEYMRDGNPDFILFDIEDELVTKNN